MSAIQELGNQQINEVMTVAVDRRAPVILTVQRGRNWRTTSAKALALRDVHLLLELNGEEADRQFIPAEKVGMSMKIKHHKHIFTATVVGVERGEAGDVLVVCRPSRMQRLQRRAYARSEVPPNRIVRASFWLGGRTAEPVGGLPTTPVWSGRVVNLSAGGFQLHTDAAAAGDVEAGDAVRTRIVFGMGEQAVYADAEVRHAELSSARAMIGFRFVALDQTHEGRTALQLIASKVSEYERTTRAERMATAKESAAAPPVAVHAAAEGL
ncbi:MAG: PilZ domain-containing protein [Phycisphaerae bacterium]|nr:PilZ domain-containing protein [Phycisphaerae bacterium]